MGKDELSEYEKAELLGRSDATYPNDYDIQLMTAFLYWAPFAKLEYIPAKKRRALARYAFLPEEDIDNIPMEYQKTTRAAIVDALIIGYQAALQLGEPLIDMKLLENDPEW